MDIPGGNFRAVPDGQYTQTIYSLIRDQKYTEVSCNSLNISFSGHSNFE